MSQKSVNLSLGKHLRIKAPNTPFLTEFLSVSRKCSSPNKFYLDKLVDIWRNLPDSEQYNYNLLPDASNSSNDNLKKTESPSPRKIRLNRSPPLLLRSPLDKQQNENFLTSVTPEPTIHNKSADSLASSRSYQIMKKDRTLIYNPILHKNQSFKVKTLMTSPYRDKKLKVSKVARDLAMKISKETEKKVRKSPSPEKSPVFKDESFIFG